MATGKEISRSRPPSRWFDFDRGGVELDRAAGSGQRIHRCLFLTPRKQETDNQQVCEFEFHRLHYSMVMIPPEAVRHGDTSGFAKRI